MQIIQRKISTLKPAEYNPRRLTDKQYQNLKDSLENFDVVEPAVINMHHDRKNVIIGGHQRIKVAKDLGYKEFPCVEISLPIEKEKELNIRLNKNTGEFDFDMLANEFETGDLVHWGFELKELDIPNFESAPEEEQGKLDEKAKIQCPECGYEFEN